MHSLDLLRGLAALSVCWFHLTSFHYPTPDGPGYHWVRQSGVYGWLGVEVFFVISGFVIPYSLSRARYRLASYPAFMARRLVRLDPPYLATIVVVLALAFALAAYSGRPFLVEGEPVGWTRVLLHLGYLNMFFDEAWLNPGFWTLAIEFQYYLLIGLIFPLLMSREPVTRLTVLGAFVLSSLLTTHDRAAGQPPYHAFVFHFAFLFAMGFLTFQFREGLIRIGEFLALLLVASAGALATVGAPSTLAGLFAVLVMTTCDRRVGVAAFFGAISYSLYLLHWPLGHLTLSVVGSKLLGATSDGARVAVLLFTLAVCIAAAWLLYVCVERPRSAGPHPSATGGVTIGRPRRAKTR